MSNLRSTLWLVAALVFAVVLWLFERQAALVLPAFATWVRSLGMWAPVAFVAGYGLAAVLLVPCVVLTLAAGALWGVGLGLLYVAIGAWLGATLAFLSGRFLVRRFVQAYVDRHPPLAAIDRAVESEGTRLVFLLRLSPVVPYTLLNYVLGISRLSFGDYQRGLVGMLPATLTYVYAGKVAGDLASLATGQAALHGAAYYVTLGIGLAATVLATVLLTRAAKRAIDRQM